MNLHSISKVYFIGIGGIGMSAIARYFNKMGKCVSGYDKTPTALTDELINEGIKIHFEDDINLAPQEVRNTDNKEGTLVIYTPAIPKTHSELNFFIDNKFEIVKRSQMLGVLTQGNKTIAVAGTHGKTTTSSIIAHVLKHSGINCAAFLGGISKNYNSNFILPEQAGKEIINVVEADEYDRSFLQLFPQYAIITSMDADHLDIYGNETEMIKSYNDFAAQVKDDGLLIYKKGLPVNNIPAKAKTYSINSTADFYTSDISIKNNQYCFDVVAEGKELKGFTLGQPGRHNVENSVAAIAVALHIGITEEKIKSSLETYTGVKRRFDIQLKNNSVVFIDDYAHHPEELRAAISSVKELYHDKKITGIFQPHLFSRTRDFANEFGESLSLLDEAIMLDIYPARELPMEGVTSKLILDKIKTANKKLLSKEQTLEYIKANAFEVVLTLGAGDIDAMVEPIRNILEKK